MNENFSKAATTAALVFGAVAGAAVLARRASGFREPGIVPPLDVDELGPIVVDAGGPLVIRAVAPIAPPPPTFFERVTTFLGDTVDAMTRAAQPREIRNNNPGNIRTIKRNPWRGQVGDDRGYGIYDTMASGVRALGKQLLAYEKRGLRSVQAIIETWAPAIGRDPVTGKTYTQATPAYVVAVTRELGVTATQPLDVNARLVELAGAIIHHENGDAFETYVAPGLGRNYTRDELARWVRLP